MESKRVYLGLDIGTARIGIAAGDSIAKIAQPLATIAAAPFDGNQLTQHMAQTGATDLVVGLPRNQSGETTAQTQLVQDFVHEKLEGFGLPIHWQDESVTSVMAEDRLKHFKKPYTKADVDAEAAAIILQDFLEEQRI